MDYIPYLRPHVPTSQHTVSRCQAPEGGNSSPISQLRAWANMFNFGLNGGSPAKPVPNLVEPEGESKTESKPEAAPVSSRGASADLDSWENWLEV